MWIGIWSSSVSRLCGYFWSSNSWSYGLMDYCVWYDYTRYKCGMKGRSLLPLKNYTDDQSIHIQYFQLFTIMYYSNQLQCISPAKINEIWALNLCFYVTEYIYTYWTAKKIDSEAKVITSITNQWRTVVLNGRSSSLWQNATLKFYAAGNGQFHIAPETELAQHLPIFQAKLPRSRR